jgi:rhombotail lipoprotein
VDAVMLLSFDQVQFTDEGAMTMSYWTIVGYYVVPAEKNLTKTVLEAAVYDIASRRLLFRASGAGNVKGSSTPVNLSEGLRVDSKKSFDLAATDLAANLKTQIAGFEKHVANNPGKFITQHKPGNSTPGIFGE